jgi:hypothetical protein
MQIQLTFFYLSSLSRFFIYLPFSTGEQSQRLLAQFSVSSRKATWRCKNRHQRIVSCSQKFDDLKQLKVQNMGAFRSNQHAIVTSLLNEMKEKWRNIRIRNGETSHCKFFDNGRHITSNNMEALSVTKLRFTHLKEF